MSKPTIEGIEELAALACARISYQVHCEESETANYSEIDAARLEAETALVDLIRAVVEEMRPEDPHKEFKQEALGNMNQRYQGDK